MDKKDKRNQFLYVLLGIFSLLLVIILSMFLLDTTDKINQGFFRINDLVVFSTININDNQNDLSIDSEVTDEEKETNISDYKFDISQENVISILVHNIDETDIKSIYIDNIEIRYPLLSENMFIYQTDENKININNENFKLDLFSENQDGQYLIKFNIDNVNCVKQASIPENETITVFDGTILDKLDIKISDVIFSLQFNLNILDSNNKLNICKMNLNLPNELLITNGVSIKKENISNFVFRIK